MQNGVAVRVNTKQRDKEVAKDLESKRRTEMALDEAGLPTGKTIPTLKGFEKQFNEAIEARCPKGTAKFYKAKMADLLAFAPLANARLNRIDEALIEKFVLFRRKQVAHPERKSSKKTVTPATVNRALATLRRALRLAQEWRIIARVPRIKMLGGERNREFVLSREKEAEYLAACPELLKDMALLILDTGLRVGEATRLEWEDVTLDPVEQAKHGFIQVRKGKTKNAVRAIPLTERAAKMLKERVDTATDEFVFTQCVPTYLCRLHSRVREKMGLPMDFVIHSLRHTALTRLGELNTDAWTLMKLAGHGSIAVTQRYMHPSSESMGRAIEKLGLGFGPGLAHETEKAAEYPSKLLTV